MKNDLVINLYGVKFVTMLFCIAAFLIRTILRVLRVPVSIDMKGEIWHPTDARLITKDV